MISIIFYIIIFLIGTIIGMFLSFFIVGATTKNKEQEYYSLGFHDGYNKRKEEENEISCNRAQT